MFIRFCFFFLFIFFKGFAQDPDVLYLTWKSDPATTMTIIWHTTTGKIPKDPIYYKRLNEVRWRKAQEEVSERLCRSSIEIHSLELQNLHEDTEYVFRFADGKIHRFRTLPKNLSRPIHVVVGGDAFFDRDLYEKMNREVASKNPDFVILAGDLAYTEGIRRALKTHYWKVNRWEEFFRIWSEQMITQEGRMIPIVPVIGNHDVCQSDQPEKKDVIFYQVFAFPKRGIPFRTLSVGSDVVFFLLDTSYTYPIAGAQTEWLKETLQSHQKARYKIPIYHLPAYPSESYFQSLESKNIRKFWVPLFQEYGVKISIEHDNHTFKRTFPIKDGMVDQDGIVFLGDGAWGVFPLKPKRHWYLAKASNVNNYWLLRITPEKLKAYALSNEGELLDEVEVAPHLGYNHSMRF